MFSTTDKKSCDIGNSIIVIIYCGVKKKLTESILQMKFTWQFWVSLENTFQGAEVTIEDIFFLFCRPCWPPVFFLFSLPPWYFYSFLSSISWPFYFPVFSWRSCYHSILGRCGESGWSFAWPPPFDFIKSSKSDVINECLDSRLQSSMQVFCHKPPLQLHWAQLFSYFRRKCSCIFLPDGGLLGNFFCHTTLATIVARLTLL